MCIFVHNNLRLMLLEILGFLHLEPVDAFDILLVALVIYVIFRWIRGSSAMNIFIAIMMLLLVRIIASAVGMKMISSLLGTVIDVGALALIVIFQPEIRRFLVRLGRTAGSTLEKGSFLARLLPNRNSNGLDEKAVSQVAQACKEMSESRTGALIVLRRRSSLDDIIATGDTLDAEISTRLILNVFFKNSPLHDGAMIIGGGRIEAARCTLPITDRDDIPARMGMRHKAAIGLSEQCDADIVVVSEQTGEISYVHEGAVTPVHSTNALKLLLKGERTREQ